MASDMRIRLARAPDRDRLLELWERSVRATHDFLGDGDIEGLRPLVAAALASDALDWCVLVESSDAPIGFLGTADDRIEALFIDPAHHGRGGGRLLVAHAQRLVAGSLAVDVNEQNEGARAFYERLGFAVVGRSPLDAGGRPFPILHMRRAAPDAHADAR